MEGKACIDSSLISRCFLFLMLIILRLCHSAVGLVLLCSDLLWPCCCKAETEVWSPGHIAGLVMFKWNRKQRFCQAWLADLLHLGGTLRNTQHCTHTHTHCCVLTCWTDADKCYWKLCCKIKQDVKKHTHTLTHSLCSINAHWSSPYVCPLS